MLLLSTEVPWGMPWLRSLANLVFELVGLSSIERQAHWRHDASFNLPASHV